MIFLSVVAVCMTACLVALIASGNADKAAEAAAPCTMAFGVLAVIMFFLEADA